MLNKTIDLDLKTICSLYHSYKDKSDEDIIQYLEQIPIYQLSKDDKFLTLSEKSKETIKTGLRKVSLSFDAFETDIIEEDVEIFEEFYYLVKSSSKFFLKPDIGEIFDALNYNYLDLHSLAGIVYCPELYETLPGTQGEHFLMKGFLLRKKEHLTENHYECIEDFYMDSGFKALTKGLYYEINRKNLEDYSVKSNLKHFCKHSMSNFSKNFKEKLNKNV